MKEKRQHPRYNVELRAEVFTGKEIIPVLTRNISKGGLSLVLNRPIEEGKTIAISLFVTEDGIEDPDREPLNLKAKLVWCAEQEDGSYVVGARFMELKPEEDRILDSLISILEKGEEK